MSSVDATQEKFENRIITGHLRFVLEENSGTEVSRYYLDAIVFGKLHFARKCLPPTLERKASLTEFLQFAAERFRKLRFRDRLDWMVGPNGGN